MSVATDLGLAAGECMDWVGHFWNVSVGAGNGAKNLLGVAQQRGWAISPDPTVGSIAVYQPGTYYLANGTPFNVDPNLGHVAMVTAVDSPSEYTMSEMNGVAGYGNVDTQQMRLSGPVAFVTPPSSLMVDGNFQNTFGESGAQQPGAVLASNVSSTGTGTASPYASGQCVSLSDATTGGIPILSGATGFFHWLGQACVYKRILIYGICAGLIIYGLKFVGSPQAANAVEAPVKAVTRV